MSEDGSIRSVTEHSYDSVPAPEGRIRLGALLRSQFTDYVAGGTKHTTDYFFDGLGRPIRTDYTLPSDLEPSNSQTFRIVTGYDSLGRVASVTYPKLPGHADATLAFFEYAPAETSNGRLASVSSAERLQFGAPTKLTTLWKAEATDQQDRLSRFMAGSVHTEHQFDWRGLTTSTVIRNDDLDADNSNVALAMLQFAYDGEGNLSSRSDDLQAATRHYRYDSMNRLQWELTDPGCMLSVTSKCVVDALAYDKLGNLADSKLRGVYTFNPLKPTQLMSATGGSVANGTRTYAYDYLGNQVERPDGNVTFNDFNLPARIVGKTNAGEVTAAFLYAPNGSRARRVTRDETVSYAGPYERHRKAGTNRVEHRLHVPGTGTTLRYEGDDAFVSKLPTAFSHGDHLGSTSLVTQNELETSGGMFTKVLEKRHYEAFGLPMNPNWSAPNPFSDLQTPVLDQGFTGHTEDRAIGVVSMRGRMYDAELGRFITTDPMVDGANPSQAWNRYAYVSNNPLRYTDPTGFFMDHDNGGRGGDCQNPDGTPCVAAGWGRSNSRAVAACSASLCRSVRRCSPAVWRCTTGPRTTSISAVDRRARRRRRISRPRLGAMAEAAPPVVLPATAGMAAPAMRPSSPRLPRTALRAARRAAAVARGAIRASRITGLATDRNARPATILTSGRTAGSATRKHSARSPAALA